MAWVYKQCIKSGLLLFSDIVKLQWREKYWTEVGEKAGEEREGPGRRRKK